MIQRIVNKESGFRCLACNGRITGLSDGVPYRCGYCGQVHQVSLHPTEERAILTKNEYAWFHKKFPMSKEIKLKLENARLRLELKQKGKVIFDLTNENAVLEEKIKKLTRKRKEVKEGESCI